MKRYIFIFQICTLYASNQIKAADFDMDIIKIIDTRNGLEFHPSRGDWRNKDNWEEIEEFED